MSREIVIRISIPEGVATPQVDYQDEPPHPAGPPIGSNGTPFPPPGVSASAHSTESSTPQCKHGPMYFKKGTNKSGKDYAGYFCSSDECKPVWSKA